MNNNFDRILGRFPLRRLGNDDPVNDLGIKAVYARQGNKRFVSSLIFPDNMTEQEVNQTMTELGDLTNFRDDDVVWRSTEQASSGFEVENPVVFRSGTWKGINVSVQDMQSIETNAEILKQYGEVHVPILLNHNEDDVKATVGKIFNPIVVNDKVIPQFFTILDSETLRKYLSGVYGPISPYLVKDYTFDTGTDQKTLSGWTLRHVAFVVHQQDKGLNLTMSESEVIITMPGTQSNGGLTTTSDPIQLELSEMKTSVIKLQTDLKMKENELETAKQSLTLKEGEITTLKTKMEDIEKAQKESEIETVLKMFEGNNPKGEVRIKPADHEEVKKHVLTLSEEQYKFWKKDMEARPIVLKMDEKGSALPATSDDAAAKAKAKEILTRMGVKPVDGGN